MTLSCRTQKIVKAKQLKQTKQKKKELDEEEEEEEEEDNDDDDEVALMLYGGFKLRTAEPLILHARMENESHKFPILPILYCLCPKNESPNNLF
ncbi:hypothetical protein T07_9191 [Trichinella nelsoni]|uniref:Uncharacterized protein n=1 Tax=Trichinella nelsoni TaxID=6336 RepID=A0A0V0RQI7_9BILA|nr:hypothetical protein T07_9191 [Trichinella nelsoni]